MEPTIARLQYITDGNDPQRIAAQCAAFLENGGRWIQLRMKEAGDDLFMETARLLRELTRRYGATLLINDRADIAARCDADGVHLGKSDMDTPAARKLLPGKIVGRTANTLDDVIAFCGSGADYIGLGPLRFTATKKNLSPVIGFDGYENLFAELRRRGIVPLPTVGIGGVTLDDLEPLSRTGLYGVAVSSSITRAADPGAATAAFVAGVARFQDRLSGTK